MQGFRDMTIGRLLSDLALSLPDQEALVYPDRNLRWSFSRLQREAVQLARGLMAAGIEKGDRVAQGRRHSCDGKHVFAAQ